MAVLESGENRKDLPCSVTPNKPTLGFDLKFHSGYDITMPMRELAGNENLLSVLFRVAPAANREETTYFTQRIRVPMVAEDAKGDALVQGFFDVGEGNYHVDLLIRDRAERVCSFSWDTEAALPAKEKQIQMVLAANAIAGSEGDQFLAEKDIQRSGDAVNLKVLINFAPQNPHARAMQPLDLTALVSILRQIDKHPNIGKVSLVAFNMQEQRVIYRQEDAAQIDFPQLGKAVHGVTLGTVSVEQLARKNSETEFLVGLIKSELVGSVKPDAVVFAGPKVLLDSNPSKEDLAETRSEVDFPIFYMNYNLNPQQIPWTDAIGRAVKMYKGTEFTISRPRDLWNSVTEMFARVVKSKQLKNSATASVPASN
ncbi:MAG: acetyltransferase [Acidobacteria bacterium]|nr:acetyltransferase [Acidobacteriota bacterium]